MRIAVAVIALSFLAGCAPQEGTPVVTPPTVQKIDCDLIFPAPSRDTLAP